MNHIATIYVAVGFIGGCVLLTYLVTGVVGRSRWYKNTEVSTEFLGIVYPMIGSIYGVLLAFSIVLSWERFAQAEEFTSSETVSLSSMWRNVQMFTPQDRLPIEHSLIRYAGSVAHNEWHMLATTGLSDENTSKAYAALWQKFRAYTPKTDNEIAFYSSALEQLTEVGHQRRYRTNAAMSEISGVVWIFLVLGGVVSIGVPIIMWNGSSRYHSLLNAMMAFIVSFSIWIVAALQYPYSGNMSVTNGRFESLESDFRERHEITVQCLPDELQSLDEVCK